MDAEQLSIINCSWLVCSTRREVEEEGVEEERRGGEGKKKDGNGGERVKVHRNAENRPCCSNKCDNKEEILSNKMLLGLIKTFLREKCE